MYAIIATGGKQYKVAEGDIIRVEKLGVEAGETYTHLTRYLQLTTTRWLLVTQQLKVQQLQLL